MRPLKIALDIDGVLADWEGHTRAMYETWFGSRLRPSTHWHHLEEQSHFSSSDEFWEWINRVPTFWDDMPPIPGALGGVYDLLAHNHTFILVTNRKSDISVSTKRWVERHWPTFAGKPFPRIEHVAQAKSVVDAQVYIDDNPRVLAQLVEAGKPYVIAFKQPWNSHLKMEGLTVANGWRELVGVVQRIADPKWKEPLDGQQHLPGTLPEEVTA